MNKSFNAQCSLTKLVLLLLMDVISDVTCVISGIYTTFCRLLCKKCDVGYYVIDHNESDDYCLLFIVSISLLLKIHNACQN